MHKPGKTMGIDDIFNALRTKLLRLTDELGLGADEVVITTPLTATEAIGNPEDRDYPIITGRETMLQAVVRDAAGQAFTDMAGNFSAPVRDIATMPLANNFRRAIFVATLNAVCRYAGLLEVSRHCRDTAPRRCAEDVFQYITNNFGSDDNLRILVVGFQPRLIERMAASYDVRVTDLDSTNVGQKRFGATVYNAEKTPELLEWCNLALVTGTTLANGTIAPFVERAQSGLPTLFYGVTIGGAARLLNLAHVCPCGN
ncbi:MAG: hypothetical protein GX604_03735 [Actinobacteria bacterium]|nr:hypothetical protein [Actinomycetota bacterium]